MRIRIFTLLAVAVVSLAAGALLGFVRATLAVSRIHVVGGALEISPREDPSSEAEDTGASFGSGSSSSDSAAGPLPEAPPAITALSTESGEYAPVVAPSGTTMPHADVTPQLRDELLRKGTSVRCVSVGMQEKCLFHNLVVRNNEFFVFGDAIKRTPFPNPIYPPDGQREPLARYHKYSGHRIAHLGDPGDGSGVCAHYVTRPTVFLYRMSGHSTYHAWENNLGPFFATLQEPFGLPARDAAGLRFALNNRSDLLIAFVDAKPGEGPKAPRLLNLLLRTFTSEPLWDAAQITTSTCFATAIVGISASSFPHDALVRRVLGVVLAPLSPPPLPAEPKVLYVSRSHPSVVRGRKVVNENEVLAALNETILNETGAAVRAVFMEDFDYFSQIRLAARTNVMLSPHGGGVAQCIWMTRGSVMVEFVPPAGRTLPQMYHTMCSRSGVTHLHFVAEPDPRDVERPDAELQNNRRLFGNMVVPPDRMVANARRALTVYRENRARYAKRDGLLT